MTHIPIEKWGRDHWSTLAYIETRIVDHKGVLDQRHMRTDAALHPQFSSRPGGPYPSRLKDGETKDGHDDWSCADDAEAEDLLENVGTGIHRVYRLTDKGLKVATQLRTHKASGGQFSTFCPDLEDSTPSVSQGT